MNKLLAALLACAIILPVQAQTSSSPSKKELVAKVLKLQQPGIESVARQMVEQPALILLQRAAALIQQNVPVDRRDALAKDIQADVRQYVEETVPSVRERAVKLAPSTIGVVLEERMTDDELKQVIVILESPINRKFQSLAQDMQKALAEKLVAESRTAVEGKVRTLEQTIGRRVSAAASGAAGNGK